MKVFINKEIVTVFISLLFGFILILLLDLLDFYYFQALVAKIFGNFLRLFFDLVEVKHEKILVNNFELVITEDCIKISSFFLLLPILVIKKKIFSLILLFILFSLQNFLRIFFEIFLILNFSLNLDYFLSLFQNVIQPLILYVALILKQIKISTLQSKLFRTAQRKNFFLLLV